MPGRPDNGVERVIAACPEGELVIDGRPTTAAAGTGAALAALWGISPQAVTRFRRDGYFPIQRAKDAAERFGIPMRDLVAPDIREGMLRDAMLHG